MSERGEALAGRLFEALLGTAESAERVPRRSARALRRPRTGRSRNLGGAGRPRQHRGTLRPRMAGAAGGGGIIECDDPSAGESERSYSLPSEYAEVLLDPDSQSYLAPMARMFVAASQQLPALMEAFRTGGGVGWARYGPDMSEGQEAGNRPFYVGSMGDWIAGACPTSTSG